MRSLRSFRKFKIIRCSFSNFHNNNNNLTHPSVVNRFSKELYYTNNDENDISKTNIDEDFVDSEDSATGILEEEASDELLGSDFDFDSRMKYVYELYSIYRISVFTSVGIISIIFLLIMIFRKYLSRRLSKEVAEIGSQTLDEEKLKNSANALSRKIVSEMLSDKEIARLSLNFLQNLFQHPDVKETVLSILQNLLSDEEVRGQCEKILVNTWNSLTIDPTSLENASRFFGRIFHSNDVKVAVEELFVKIFNEDSMKNETAKFYSDVLEQSVFRDRFFNLTKNTLNKVIIQQKTKDNAKDFICKILEDEEMKQEASQFLFDAAKLMITPKWLQNAPKKKEEEKEVEEEVEEVEEIIELEEEEEEPKILENSEINQ